MRLIIFLLVLVSGAALAIDIENVKGGPLIESSQLIIDSSWPIPYKENSDCDAEIKKSRCMAIGFSFSYSLENEDDSLYCTVNIENKGKIFRLYDGVIKFPEKKGSFIMPGSLHRDPGDSGIIKMSLNCHGKSSGYVSKEILVNFDK